MLTQEEGVMEEVEGEVKEDPEVEEETTKEIEVRIMISQKSPASTVEERDIWLPIAQVQRNLEETDRMKSERMEEGIRKLLWQQMTNLRKPRWLWS